MGALPDPAEEPTPSQLAALQKRTITNDAAPYVDFSVWLPFERRTGKAQKYRTVFPLGDGSYLTKELPGPATYQAWLSFWRVFKSAALMIGICSLASLQTYERFVERLTIQWPTAWGLIAQAEDKVRAEGLDRWRRKIQAAAALGRQVPQDWDPMQPWNSIFVVVTQDTEYWAENVHHPAAAWIASGSRGKPVVASEAAVMANLPGGTDLLEVQDDDKKRKSQANRDKRAARRQRISTDWEELGAKEQERAREKWSQRISQASLCVSVGVREKVSVANNPLEQSASIVWNGSISVGSVYPQVTKRVHAPQRTDATDCRSCENFSVALDADGGFGGESVCKFLVDLLSSLIHPLWNFCSVSLRACQRLWSFALGSVEMKRSYSPGPAESYSYEDTEESSPECDVEIGDPNHGVEGMEIEAPQPVVGRKVPSPETPASEGSRREATKEETNRSMGGKIPVVPARVQEALDKAKDFGEFRDLRTFVFVHYFSGPEDKLAEAIVKVAKTAGLKVEVFSLDTKIDRNADLTRLEVYERWETKVEQGDLDGSHAGFPCGSFSRVRWVPGEDLPPPVRSLEEIYGLSSNDESQQREADRGTLLASRAAWLMQKQVKSQRERGVPEVATLENPPGSKDQHEGPAWRLPELMEVMKQTGSGLVDFNTCGYMSKEKYRYFKPARWAGRLEELTSLSRVRRCPPWVVHVQVRGKDTTVKSGVYPSELVDAVAAKIISSWKRTLNLEFWREELRRKGEKLSELRQKWLKNEEARVKKSTARMPEQPLDLEKEIGTPTVIPRENPNVDHVPHSTVTMNKKARRALENKFYLGGMRNPAEAVKRLWKLRDTGRMMRKEWVDFVKERPEALRLGERYGSAEAMEWELRLRTLLEAKMGESADVQESVERRPVESLDREVWRPWCSYRRVGGKGSPLGDESYQPGLGGSFSPVRGRAYKWQHGEPWDRGPAAHHQLQVLHQQPGWRRDRSPKVCRGRICGSVALGGGEGQVWSGDSEQVGTHHQG